MTPPLIQPLPQAADVALAGGKAVNLGTLLRAGFPVPTGFVITTHAYRVARGLSEIPQDIRETILTAYHALAPVQNPNSKIEYPLVAVRSSATAEDMAGASMAGQYDTFLDIHDDDSLLAAVRACWASLDSPRTRAYLQQNNIPLEKIAMGVVVQLLVPAEIAGVMFTVNPHNGSRDEMLIEAAWGLGESVVSGRVQPDVLRIRASDGHLVEQVIADKHIMIRAHGAGGHRHNGNHAEEPVPDDRRKVPCLDAACIRQLHALAQRAATHFESPQDIEWAIADGKVYQLQSRPITTLAALDAYHEVLSTTRATLTRLATEKRGPWALHNLAETLPHPTPLTWSIIGPFMSATGGFGTMYRLAGFDPFALSSSSAGNWKLETGNFLTLIAGRVYMDASRAPLMFFDPYPFAYDPEVLRKNPEASQNPPTIPCGPLRDRLRAARKIARANARLHDLSATFDHTLRDEIIPAFVTWCESEKRRDLAKLSNADLAALWKTRVEKVLGDFAPRSLLPSLIAGVLVEDLRAFLAENFWDADADELATTLASPVTPDRTLAANAALWEVAHSKRTLDSWLADFGHRAPNEFDLSAPRWRERPKELAAMAARMRTGPYPASQHGAHVEKVQAMQHALSHRLSRKNAAHLAALCDTARRHMIFREDAKYYLMLGYDLLRDLALEAAARLTAAGVIDSPDDIFYLTDSDLQAALASPIPNPKSKIQNARARLRHAAEARLSLPRFIDAAGIATLGNPAAGLDPAAPRYEAFPLSTGSSRGRVRIVKDPATAGDLGQDYILVCPSTDPAWTPLFVSAAGLVLECGGTLSHGAVVAREMGIPAVVLPDATTLLTEDELITVDGHTGALYRDTPTPSATPSTTITTTTTKPPLPPPPGRKERFSRKLRTTALIVWTLYLLFTFLLPSNYLYEPSLAVLDFLLWPLVRTLGKPGAVAAIAALMALATMLGQYLLTDVPRLREAKRRAARLAKLRKSSPETGNWKPETASVQSRILGATFVPLAVLLGPMVMTFMWLPARVDPASASAPAGSDVQILVDVDSAYRDPITLAPPAGFTLRAAPRGIAPVKETLESLLKDPAALTAAITAHPQGAPADPPADLRAYLAALPPQRLRWDLASDSTTAAGRFTATLRTTRGDTAIPFVLGDVSAPAPLQLLGDGPIQTISIQPKKSAAKAAFYPVDFTLANRHVHFDATWLGVYLLAYLPLMLILKFSLRLP